VKRSARAVAWEVLERVERDRAFAELALHGALRDSDLPRRERALATELSYGALRLRGRLDAALAQCLDRPLRHLEPRLRQLLRLGAYQILCLHGVGDAPAVHATVELAKQGGLERAAGLVNAVLRRLVRRVEEGSLRFPSLAEDPLAHLEQWGSLPGWLAQRWLDELGAAEAAALAEALLAPPPRTVRVAESADIDALARRLRARRTPYAPRGLTDLGADPARDPAFERGEITIQDEASQLMPLLLGARRGDAVVDCCAAPGSKTAQLAEIVGPTGEVTAFELHASRIPLIRRQLARLGLSNARVLERDVRQGFDLRGRTSYRAILVDAPCTGLGALRRNPDARWRLRPEDVPRCAALALELLSSAGRYVEPGGALVYSVCTFTPEETEHTVTRFLAEHGDFARGDPRPFLPAAAAKLVDERAALRTLPHRDGCDGFYAVRLERR
jgi:16S rRNA (cytosine967-C5)-methyltransferase